MRSRIRAVDHRDHAIAHEIVRLQRRSYAVEAELIHFAGIPNLTESADDVRSLDLTFVAAFDGDAVVGIVGYGYRRDGAVVDIDRLAVDPAAFRRGVGRALLRDVIVREGPVEFVVSAAAANTPAIRLYESCGFRRTNDEVIEAGLHVVELRRGHGGGVSALMPRPRRP